MNAEADIHEDDRKEALRVLANVKDRKKETFLRCFWALFLYTERKLVRTSEIDKRPLSCHDYPKGPKQCVIGAIIHTIRIVLPYQYGDGRYNYYNRERYQANIFSAKYGYDLDTSKLQDVYDYVEGAMDHCTEERRYTRAVEWLARKASYEAAHPDEPSEYEQLGAYYERKNAERAEYDSIIAERIRDAERGARAVENQYATEATLYRNLHEALGRTKTGPRWR